MTPSRTTGWSEEAHLDTINPVPKSEDNWWASVMMIRLISTEGPATKSKLSSFPDPLGRWQVLQLDKAHSHPQVVWSRNYYKPKSNSREEIRNKTKNLLGAKSQATGGVENKGLLQTKWNTYCFTRTSRLSEATWWWDRSAAYLNFKTRDKF